MSVTLQSAVNTSTVNFTQVHGRISPAPEAALELLKLVSGDGFGTRAAHGILPGGCLPLPHPRGRILPPSLPPQPQAGRLLDRLTHFLQALTQLLSQLGRPGSMGGAPGGVTGPQPWETEFLKNAPPAVRENFNVLQRNNLPVSQQEAQAMSGKGPQEMARFMLQKFASTPADIQPPQAVDHNLRMVDDRERAGYQLQKQATRQFQAFNLLMHSLDNGGPSPALEQQHLRYLDDRQKSQYMTAKAARATGTPAPNGAAIDRVRSIALRENEAFNRVLDMMGRGGPQSPADWGQYTQDLQALSPENRELAFRAGRDPRAQMMARETVSKQTRAFVEMLDVLKHAGPSHGPTSLLGQAMAQNWQYLNPTQRAAFEQLRSGSGNPTVDPRTRLMELMQQSWVNGNAFDPQLNAYRSVLTRLQLGGAPKPGSVEDQQLQANLAQLAPEQRKNVQEVIDALRRGGTAQPSGAGPAAGAFTAVGALANLLRDQQERAGALRRPIVA